MICTAGPSVDFPRGDARSFCTRFLQSLLRVYFDSPERCFSISTPLHSQQEAAVGRHQFFGLDELLK